MWIRERARNGENELRKTKKDKNGVVNKRTADFIWNAKTYYTCKGKNKPLVYHNGSDYDYHFIMKRLAEEFEKTIYLFSREYRQIHNFSKSNREKKLYVSIGKYYGLYVQNDTLL